MEAEKIFEKGCLVQLTIHCWEGSKKIPKKIAMEALGSEWARATKDIVDPEKLEPMRSIRTRAIQFLNKYSLPCPIRGVRMVSFDAISTLDEGFKGFQEEMDEAVEKFAPEYPGLREAAREVLGPILWNEMDYPSEINSKFGIEWRFFVISSPENNSLLSPELVAREREKFLETMQETREMGILALRTEMKTLLDNAIDKLVPKEDGTMKRVFKSTMKENFVEFFDTFKARNIFEDQELSKILEEAKKVIEDVDIGLIKSDEQFRDDIKEEMKSVASLLEQCMEKAPKRKLRL